MDSFLRLIAAGPMFFVSAWLLMVFAGIVSPDVGIRPFGYVTSMVVTIGLWLVLAPAIGSVARGPGRKRLAETADSGARPQRELEYRSAHSLKSEYSSAEAPAFPEQDSFA